jgi:hypothetical protein
MTGQPVVFCRGNLLFVFAECDIWSKDRVADLSILN